MLVIKFFLYQLLFLVVTCAIVNPQIKSEAGYSNPDILTQLHHEPLPPPVVNGISDVIGEYWVEQKLDHFSPENNKTWQMRYFANSDLYKPGGPIFIYVGGEFPISSQWILSGRFYDIAKELGAFMFYTEHRFYGNSHPTPDTSIKSLQYLTVDQTLADLAYFIEFVKNGISAIRESKVILAGASYAGSIATWFRYKYPKHVDGAWASSALLQARTDFYEYKEIVANAYLELGGQQCYDKIQEAFTTMEILVLLNDTQRITKDINLCYPLDVKNKFDVWNMFNGLSNIMVIPVQNQGVGGVNYVCNIMTDKEHADGFAAFVKVVRLNFGNSCYSHVFEKDIERYKSTDWNNPINKAGRQWVYQTCNEFGWYHTSGRNNSLFGSNFPVDLQLEMCRRIYGEKFSKKFIDSQIKETNKAYKELNVPVKNVYFTQGEHDPWRPIGVQTDLHKSSPADVIPLVSHSKDIYSIEITDIPEMMQAKLRARTLIKIGSNKYLFDLELCDKLFFIS